MSVRKGFWRQYRRLFGWSAVIIGIFAALHHYNIQDIRSNTVPWEFALLALLCIMIDVNYFAKRKRM